MTDKEKILRAIEQKQQEIWPTDTGEMKPATVPNNLEQGWLNALTWMERYINSLPAEQLSEELEEAAKEYVKENAIIPEDCHDCEVPMYLMESATIFKDGAKWQKQQIINKACKWLNQNVVEYHPRKGELRPIVNINAFRKAMEDEQ